MAEKSRFGEVLRKLRVARGLTQEELAARAQLSARGISDLERGLKQGPRWSTVRLLIAGLELGQDAAAEIKAAARATPEDSQAAHLAFLTRRTNLPAELSTFVGREWELGELPKQLSSMRLLTLTGPGGVGKTRLALRLAARVLEQYADGVWLVELAPLAESGLVAQAVATALRVQAEDDRSLLDSLRAALSSSELLLVLDNCERLLATCAEVVEQLLRACPGIRVLTTSREPLGSAGEAVWRVSTLRKPDRTDLSAEALRQFEAVRLFAERATAAQPTFDVTEQNASAIAVICQRLDGLPLAIELAAARLNVLTSEQIARRLDDRLRLLVGGRRTAPARQQTLRSTLDWSYALLSEPEQELLRGLAVFGGGTNLEAVEALYCSKSDDVVNLLGQLVDKSLVVAELELDGTFRYGMHEMLREYALDHSEKKGELHHLRREHARYYATLVRPAESELRGQRQAFWLDAVGREHDNLRVALGWALEQREVEIGLLLGAALWRFWEYRGFLAEGDDWLTRLLCLPTPQTPLRLQVVLGAGIVAKVRGDTKRAREYFEELRRGSIEGGHNGLLAPALMQLGHLAWDENNIGLARSLAAQALAIRRHEGQPWGIAMSLQNVGGHALAAGDITAARQCLTEALDILRSLGDHAQIGFVTCMLGEVELAEGDAAQARGRFGEALKLFRELHHPEGVAQALRCFANLAIAMAQPAHGIRLLSASAAYRDAFGFKTMSMRRDRLLNTARELLGEEAASSAWNAGHSLSVQQAIQEALSQVKVEAKATTTQAVLHP